MPQADTAVPPKEISDKVSRFIYDHIPSVERLETLLLLFETKERSWTLGEIEERIRSSRDSVTMNVDALVALRMVGALAGPSPAFRYAAVDSADALVAELDAAYRLRRVAVIELIYSERRESIRSFSDAFKLGRPHDR